jgi:hypothetical protein
MRARAIVVGSLLLLMARTASLAWNAPVDITDIQNGFYELAPRAIRDSANRVHLIWYGNADDSTGWTINYQRYDGTNWTAPATISGANTANPDIAIDGADNLHVVWNAGGNPEEIYYRKSTAGVWGTIQNLSNSGAQRSIAPRLAVDTTGNSILVVWHESGQTGDNWDILSRKYTGGVWEPIENVSNDNNLSRSADVVVDAGGAFHIAWEDLGSNNLFYRKRNTDGTYGVKIALDQGSGRSFGAALAISPNGHIHAAWHDDNNGWEIVYREYNGSTWSAVVNVSQNPGVTDAQAAIECDASNQVHIAWHDYANIYYAHTVAGAWRPQYILREGANQTAPYLLAIDASRLHAFWQNRDPGSWDVMHMIQTLPDTTSPAVMQNFTATAANQQVQLRWGFGSDLDFVGTMVRFKTNGFPANASDGTLVTNAPGDTSSALHAGLSNGVTYYYGAFAYDAEPNYAAPATASATPISAPKQNLLINGPMDSFSSGVASGWRFYKANDPTNALVFSSDATNFVSAPAQGILSIASSNLPANGISPFTAAGFFQVVSNVTPGKVYQFVGYQDVYNSNFNYAGRRYLHNFGINTTGGTNPGALNTSGSIGGAQWMTSAQAFWNNNPGSAALFGGFHRARAAFVAQSNVISVWTGVIIDNNGPRDTAPAKFNLDQNYLFEWDFPANAGLQNGNFDGPVTDLQDGGDTIPQFWIPSGGGIGQINSWMCDTFGAYTNGNGLRVYSRRGVVNAGFMQKVAVNPGTSFRFSAWAQCSGQDGTMASVGIDPFGGGDINSSNIVWASTTANAWARLSAYAIAQSSAATVFLRSASSGSSGANYQWSYFDDAELVQAAPPVVFVARGSAWSYLDNGTDQGTGWRGTNFNYSSWSNGPARLGYGNDGEITKVCCETAAVKHITYYFRKTFSVSNPTNHATLAFSLLRDDGAIVYLNSNEVFRSNMPGGAVNYLTQASATVSGTDEQTSFTTNVNASVLLPGLNYLAVEVHQVTNTSSDLGFDLEVSGIPSTGSSAPTVFISSPANGAGFPAPTNITISVGAYDNGTVTNVDFYQGATRLGNDRTAPFSLTWSNVLPGTYGLTAVATDDSNLNSTSVVTVVTVTNAPVSLVATGAIWKYLDNGSDQGIAWRVLNFDDSTWASGPAELGYGDGPSPEFRPEATVVDFGPESTNKYITTYFRRAFAVADPLMFTNLSVHLLRDDGAVVYINGVEVRRDSMPAGAVTFSTLATVTVGGTDEFTFFASNVPPSMLLAGTNVIAVEVHQASASSSDLSFDCELLGHIGTNFPRLFIERSGTNHIVRWSSAAQGFALYSATNLTAPVTWTKLNTGYADDGVWRSISAAGIDGPLFFRLKSE